ncbi:sensor histidine kinase [Paenibacillus koleovorans]|uniref:sensor histidine kinase n=1 Tax=Paenibacillus koleovorans TaxID=121608 RepID=UPI000FDBDA2A|nr:sensor histidine kinase [Paenibacillus koleovorans]
MLNRMNLSQRLHLYFSIVILVTLGLVGFFSYAAASRALDSQQESRLRQIVEGTAHQTELYLRGFERASNVLVTDDSAKRILDIQADDSYSYVTLASKIKTGAFSDAFEHDPIINSLYILGRNGRYLLENNYITTPFEIQEPRQLYDSYMTAMKGSGGMTILRTALKPSMVGSVITVVRPYRGFSTYDFNGVMAMEINVGELANLWQKIDLGKGGYFFIVDEEDKLIFHPDATLMGTSFDPESASAMQGAAGGSMVRKDESGELRMYVWSYSPYSKWKLAVSVPLKELRLPAITIRWVVISVGAVALALALWIASRFAQSINRPIQVLKKGMRQTERGNWAAIETDDRKDELGALILSYNTMVKRLSEMIERVYEAELDKQQTELELRTQQLERQMVEFQALQLQINPHFLYNTLETINCYALIEESAEIREIVDAMAFMLRYALHTNFKDITVVNELNHIRYYMMILKHRIDQEFEIDVAVPPELLLEKVVRFTLQPLVENAFEHGFRKTIGSQHFIRINAFHRDDFFCMTVEDNGAGMTEERLAEVRSKLQVSRLDIEDGQDRIGMANVHRRIRMAFGDKYGLTVDSERGVGTTVTIWLPREERDRYFGT